MCDVVTIRALCTRCCRRDAPCAYVNQLRVDLNTDNTHLCNKGNDEDADEQRVAVHAGEDVVLAVDFARADLVEECHHDERGSTSRKTGPDAIVPDKNTRRHRNDGDTET